MIDLEEKIKFVDDLTLLEIVNLLIITEWTARNNMKLNTNKTKVMIFNYTNNYPFTSRITIDQTDIEIVENTKLLGTHITNDLKWDLNTKHIIKKANDRMQLL